MEKSDLKNGMSFKTRGNEEYFIIQGNLYRKTKELSLKPNGSFNYYIKNYKNDLTHKNKYSEDIVKIYDIDRNQIWESVDWDKLPIDTKVFVKNYEDSNWKKRHFAGYDKNFENSPFKTFDYGQTSWTSDGTDISNWRFCKLNEEE